MKKLALHLLPVFLLFTTAAFAQFRKVPAEVTEAFKMKYPAATGVSWSDNITAFHASFLLNEEKLETDFNSKGIWKKTVREIEADSLPRPVIMGFKQSKYHSGWELHAAIETEKDDLTYEYRLLIEKTALQKKYLYFSREGVLLREAITL